MTHHITDEKIAKLHDSMFPAPYDGHANVIRFARAVLALAAPAPAVPSGWKLVPVEPTRHMMECAEALPAIDPNDLRLRRLGWTLGACQNRRRYLQMLNAATNPDQKGSDA